MRVAVLFCFVLSRKETIAGGRSSLEGTFVGKYCRKCNQKMFCLSRIFGGGASTLSGRRVISHHWTVVHFEAEACYTSYGRQSLLQEISALLQGVLFPLSTYSSLLNTNGGAYDPIVVFTSAVNGNFITFLFNVGRIPFQVFGSIMAVRLILKIFPEIWRGPELVINLHQGALTEGLLTFSHVLITLGLDRNIDDSFFRKTWTSSILKLALRILGSDLTGGCMNPAAVAWGKISMLDAERRLLPNALQDPNNQQFVLLSILLSDSCVPLYNFDYVYNYLIFTNVSFLDCFDDPGPHGAYVA